MEQHGLQLRPDDRLRLPWHEVRTGDILGSGTCGGGCLAELWGRRGLDAHPPLAPGNTVTLSVEHLGTQTCRVTERAEHPVGDLWATSHPHHGGRR